MIVTTNRPHRTLHMCSWVGRILHPDSCTTVSYWSKVPLLSIWSVAVPFCRPLLPCPSRWHGSLPRHGLWWLTCELHCSPLPWRLGSVYQLCKSLLSCVPWSSDRTSCLSLQHVSWNSSCKGHDRSIRSSLHPWPCPSDEPQSSPRVFPVSACKVRSFYVIDYTNWMHLFNAVVKLLWKILTFIFAVLLPFWSKLTTWSCNLRPWYIPVVSNSLRAWAGQLVGRCYPSTGRPTVPIYIGLPVYRISTS